MQREDMTEALIAEFVGDIDRMGDALIAFGDRWASYAERLGGEATIEQAERLQAAFDRFSGRIEESIAKLGGGEEDNG